MIDKSMRFCTSCGKAVTEEDSVTEGISVAAAASVNSQPVVEVPVNKCPNCNAEVAEDFAFCTACGTKIS